jgi:serine protease Do
LALYEVSKLYEIALRTATLAPSRFSFILLATVSAAIVADRLPRTESAARKSRTQHDATPLKVVTTPTPPNDFVRIAKLVGPAVVNINTQTLPKQSQNGGRRNFHQFHSQPNQQNPGDDDQDNGQAGQDNFQDFLQPLLRRPGPGPDEGDNGQVQESLGSGFIVDPKGYIITNDHVIDKADKSTSSSPPIPTRRTGPSRSRHRRR